MKRLLSMFLSMLFLCMLAETVLAQKVEYLSPTPLASKVKGRFQHFHGGQWLAPGLTWGGDVATIHGIRQGYFREEGLDVKFYLQNDPAKQAQEFIDGKIPMYRGTITQICLAAEAMVNAGGKPLVLIQLTYSEGGDRLIWLDNIKQPRDLKGTTGVMQLYAPHTELLLKALKDAGLKPSDVKIRYVQEITVPTFDTKGRIIDPATAFQVDASNQWAMLISPDAVRLTGKSAEARKGARPGLSSAEANRVIADVWLVDESDFNANTQKYYAFIRGFFRAQESLEALKQSKDATYTQLLPIAAGELFGDKNMTADIEGLLADCRQMGFVGNHAFLTGAGTRRTATALIDEYQQLLVEAGLMTKKVPIGIANLDFNELKRGLKYVEEPMTPEIDYDPIAVQRYVEGRIQESSKFDEDPNVKFKTEIYFAPAQFDFDESKYGKDFELAITTAQTYGGLSIAVVGYADPGAVNKLTREHVSQQKIDDTKRQFKNLGLLRARKVIDATIAYAKKRGITLAPEQFSAVGMGVDNPKFPVPRTPEEWAQNRRVVFTVMSVSESTEFNPSDYAK